jgi:hypothetical protein
MNRFDRLMAKSPFVRTTLSLSSTLAASVLSATLIGEMTTQNGIEWTRLTHTVSFYLLLLISVLLYAYHRSLFAYDSHVLKYQDIEYCEAYVRSQCIPEAVSQYRRAMKAGDPDQLKEAKSELRRLVK